MVNNVEVFIEAYDAMKFLQLASKQQNQLIYAAFPKEDRSNLRMKKSNALKKVLEGGVKEISVLKAPKKRGPRQKRGKAVNQIHSANSFAEAESANGEISAPRPSAGEGEYHSISEETLEEYVLYLVNSGEPDVRIAQLMKDILKEKKGFNETREGVTELTPKSIELLMKDFAPGPPGKGKTRR